MHISSVLVEFLPGATDGVLKHVRETPGVTVRETAREGRIIAVVEAPDLAAALEIHKSLWDIPGVVGVQLAYHYFGEGSEADGGEL